jgi:hypothetical protein
MRQLNLLTSEGKATLGWRPLVAGVNGGIVRIAGLRALRSECPESALCVSQQLIKEK